MRFDDDNLGFFRKVLRFFTCLQALFLCAVTFINLTAEIQAGRTKTVVFMILLFAFLMVFIWIKYVFWCCVISYLFDVKLIRNKLYGISNKELAKKVYNDVCEPFNVKPDKHEEKAENVFNEVDEYDEDDEDDE